MSEIWKDIPGYSGYQASNQGRLRSLSYKRAEGGSIKVLKPSTGGQKYMKTMLKRDHDGKIHSVAVHTMVMITFKGLRPEGLEIDHIDGDTLNNVPSNLEYVTHAVNVQRAFDIGLAVGQRGESNGMSKYTENYIQDVRDKVEARKADKGKFWGRKEFAKELGLTELQLRHIIRMRTYE